MAIYHLKVQLVSRSKGHSAVAGAAYRRAEKMYDQRYDKTHDYSSKSHVVHSEMTMPDNSPTWVINRIKLHETDPRLASEQFWNFVEVNEVRKDAQLAREIQISLPIELTQEQNIVLAREFIHDQFALRGMVADWSVHFEPANPHVHVMLSLRELNDIGFGKKVREWNSKALTLEWRQKWSEYANFHLRLHNHDVRIDHRSYKDQGIELVPITHQSLAVIEMEKRGIRTDVMQRSNQDRRENLARIAQDPHKLFKKLELESSTFTHEKLGQELGRYINDKGQFSLVHKGMLSSALLRDSADTTPPLPVLTPESIATILSGIEQHESVFSERDIAKSVSAHTDHAELFSQAVIALKNSNELIALGVGDDGRERFTTRTMFHLENSLQTMADQLRKRLGVKISDASIQEELQHYERSTGKKLTDEQRNAVNHILQENSISCLVGRAGTGKSFSLAAAKSVWDNHGLDVQGVALSGIAADGLIKGAGIPSRTIESFLYALKNDSLALSAHSVVVMDEAGMTDSASMLSVLEAMKSARAKLVLVGDHAQLQPVGAGAAFKALLERIGFAEIVTIYRQKEQWQREATVSLAAGKVSDALDSYAARGCVHLEQTAHTAMQRLANDWQVSRQQTQKPLEHYLVVAHQNAQVTQLNALLRNSRIERNELSEGHFVKTTAGKIRISRGDRLLFLRNKRSLGVNNGRFATIESVNFTETGRVIDFVVKLDGSQELVKINPERYQHFTHGYAATAHKTQGITVDHSYVYADGFGWNRHLTYVAHTRHTETCHTYANQETYRDREALKKGLSRYGVKDSLLDFPLAFAARRGITANTAFLPKHLTERLIRFKEGIIDRYSKLVTPQAYQQKQTILAEQTARAQTRELAREVAVYVDANREIGIAWESVNTRLQGFGLNTLSYEPADFSLISATTEYQRFELLTAQRDALAVTLAKTPEQFTKAFDIYGLDIAKLRKEAMAHERRTQVALYLELDKAGKVVLRDRLAAHMMHEITPNYRFLKAKGVETALFRQQALAHAKRDLRRTLTKAEREGFQWVEQYQTLSQQIGKLFAETQEKKAGQSTLLVDESPVTTQLETLSIARDKLAALIVAHRDLCSPSLDFFQIGVSQPLFGKVKSDTSIYEAQVRWYKLQQAEARHVIREQIKTYETFVQEENIISRDALAAHLIENIKSHYPFLKSANIDTKLLHIHATEHAKRELLSTLSEKEQCDFYLVEHYQKISQQLGVAFAEQSKLTPEDMLKRESVMLLERLSKERQEIAYRIVQKPNDYRKALNFLQIGLAAPLFGTVSPNEQQQLFAQDRRIKLQQAAARHAILVRVQQYHTALLSGDVEKRGELAQIIVTDIKEHHGAVIKTAPVAGALWRAIRQDAQIFEKNLLIETLSPTQRADFNLVENYIRERQFTAQAWHEVLETKKSNALSHAEWEIKLAPLAKIPTQARDRLAAAIHEDQERYALGLQFFNVDIHSLNKSADADICRRYVNLYQHTTDRLHRGQLAQIISSDPKAHHGAILEAGLNWKDIYKDQRLAERLALFAELSTEEKKLWRTADKYQHVNRQAGKAWKPIFAAKNAKQSVNPKRLQAAEILSAKRNYLATQLSDQKQLVQLHGALMGHSHNLETFYKAYKIQWQSVEKQAQQYSHTVEQVQNWHSASAPARELLPHLLKADASLDKDTYYTWLALNEDVSIATQSIVKNINRYAYSLPNIGSSVQAVNAEQKQLHTLNKSLAYLDYTPEKISLDTNIQKQLERARRIESSTRAITGTLGERYLREHRAIQGNLPQSFRFHPALYNSETKQSLPALVVIAKNEKQETMAVQAIFLDKDTANKAKLNSPKLTYGSLSFGNTGVLVNLGKNSQQVALAEGVETALSIAEANPDLRVYAVLGSSNFAHAPLLSDTEKVLFCADNDGINSASHKKLQVVAEKFSQRGLNVWQTMPRQEKQDFNDVLKLQGKNAVQTLINNATQIAKGIKPCKIIHTLTRQVQDKPNMKKRSEKLLDSSAVITLEQEKRFIKAIKQYKVLKKTVDQQPFGRPKEALVAQAEKMVKHPNLMRYIQQRFPKMAQNLHALSQSKELDCGLER